MGGNVIYEKKYPSLLFQDDDDLDEEPLGTPTEAERREAAEYLKKIYKDVAYVPIPERAAERDRFVDLAVALSEYYEIDLMIREYGNRICAVYSGEHYLRFSKSKALFGMADEIEVSVRKESVELTMTYYTHATYQHGRRISPTEGD